MVSDTFEFLMLSLFHISEIPLDVAMFEAHRNNGHMSNKIEITEQHKTQTQQFKPP